MLILAYLLLNKIITLKTDLNKIELNVLIKLVSNMIFVVICYLYVFQKVFLFRINSSVLFLLKAYNKNKYEIIKGSYVSFIF